MARKEKGGAMIGLEELGLTKEEVQNRVVESIANRMLGEIGYEVDEDGEPCRIQTTLNVKVTQAAKDAANKKIQALFDKHLKPKVDSFIDELVLVETNTWGQKTGKNQTFLEYLVARADSFMREEVDSEGRDKEACNKSGRSFYKSKPRVSYMIHEYLHYHIELAMKKAIENANNSIAGGLEDAVKKALGEVTRNLKVTVKTK